MTFVLWLEGARMRATSISVSSFCLGWHSASHCRGEKVCAAPQCRGLAQNSLFILHFLEATETLLLQVRQSIVISHATSALSFVH